MEIKFYKKIIQIITVFFVIVLIAVILIALLYISIENITVKDFISGKSGDIEKIIIFDGLNEETISDEETMVYLKTIFKTLKPTTCDEGRIVSMFIYYRYRPKIYGEILIKGNNPSKACFWLNGDTGSSFEFELTHPFPDGIRCMINFINKKNINASLSYIINRCYKLFGNISTMLDVV